MTTETDAQQQATARADAARKFQYYSQQHDEMSERFETVQARYDFWIMAIAPLGALASVAASVATKTQGAKLAGLAFAMAILLVGVCNVASAMSHNQLLTILTREFVREDPSELGQRVLAAQERELGPLDRFIVVCNLLAPAFCAIGFGLLASGAA